MYSYANTIDLLVSKLAELDRVASKFYRSLTKKSFSTLIRHINIMKEKVKANEEKNIRKWRGNRKC